MLKNQIQKAPKTEQLIQASTSEYVKANIETDPEYEYIVVNEVGNCLDSDLSPIRIKDGDKLLIHLIPMTMDEIRKTVNKIVCILSTDGQFFVKQLYFYDWIGKFIGIRCFNPVEEHFYVHLSKVKALFVVDEVYSAEYIKNNTITIK